MKANFDLSFQTKSHELRQNSKKFLFFVFVFPVTRSERQTAAKATQRQRRSVQDRTIEFFFSKIWKTRFRVFAKKETKENVFSSLSLKAEMLNNSFAPKFFQSAAFKLQKIINQLNQNWVWKNSSQRTVNRLLDLKEVKIYLRSKMSCWVYEELDFQSLKGR